MEPILAPLRSFKDPVDISIPLRFDDRQPNAFSVERASSKPCEYGPLEGDTRRGGSCNFEQITLIPHCNGTHTECVGHITNERISIRDRLKDVIISAFLITVEPVRADSSSESYGGRSEPADLIIARKSLEPALTDTACEALIVRTLPNDDTKLMRQYGGSNPPYFSADAMGLMVASGVKHLLVDLPSIDREDDGGALSNHRVFWNVPPGSFEAGPTTRMNSTVTELIYVPNEIADGRYYLNLQVAPFQSDAAPSRPLLFSVDAGQ